MRMLRIATAATLATAWFIPSPARAQCADGSPPPCRQAPRPPAATAIAVLYFDNLSRDSNDVYLADGLTEELISRLTQIEQLQVKSRTAVARLRGRAGYDPAAIGRTLGVSQFLSGSVQRSGPRLRVNVELTRTSTGNSVWARSFDRRADDLLGVQAEIAESIAVHVAGRLAPVERQRLAQQPTTNPRAYDHYLRGRFHTSHNTTDAVRRGVRELETALRLDSTLTPALLRLASAYSLLSSLYYSPSLGVSRDSLAALSNAALARAIRRDSLSTGVVLVRAQREDAVVGVGLLADAIARDPRNPDLQSWYGLGLRQLGRDSAAIAHFIRAGALDPDNGMTPFLIGQTHLLARRYRDAARWMDSALTLQPDAYFFYSELGTARLFLDDTAGARVMADLAAQHGGNDARDELYALIEARSGDTSAALARLARVEARLASADCEVSHACLDLAYALAAVGARERALAVVERLKPPGSWIYYWLSHPALDSIRQDPRFVRIIQRSQAAMEAARTTRR
jgi:TolB-like protein/tetratricopeptide (TPR) repeat protein